MRLLIAILAISMASTAFAGKKQPCSITVAQATAQGQKITAERDMKFFTINKANTKKILDIINAAPPVTDVKADGMIVLEGAEVVAFAYIVGECASRPVPVTRQDWDKLQAEAFGADS